MHDSFAAPTAAISLHRRLAELAPPVIVDTWYDDTMAAALRATGRDDWGIVRGASRAEEVRDVWVAYEDAHGRAVEPAAAQGWRTVLYKPHGAAATRPLVADSDYVEVLTEIDIQTPIPPVVKARREGRSFLFLGCRFDDQLLRTYARQIIKRSRGPHHAVLAAAELTRHERLLLGEQGILAINRPLAEVALELARG